MSNAVLKGHASGTGTVTLETPNTNTDRTISFPDVNGTVVVSGTTPSLNGISFPATQSASADANTLDDYEEGTWTPVVTAQTGSITSYTASGLYVKIGQMVMIYGYIKITNAGTATDNMFIAGFPFTTAATGGGSGVNVLVARENDVTGNMGQVRIDSSGTTGLLRRYDNGLSGSIMTTNYGWNFNGCYRASA